MKGRGRDDHLKNFYVCWSDSLRSSTWWLSKWNFICVPPTHCHSRFRLRMTGATLPPSDHIPLITVICRQRSSSLTQRGLVWWNCFGWISFWFGFVLFCFFVKLSWMDIKKRIKKREPFEILRYYRNRLSVYLLYLLIAIGQSTPAE